MADHKAVAVLLVILFARSIPTTALNKPQASTGTDRLHRQATTAPATYVIGGGYLTTSGQNASTSCDAVGFRGIATFEECQSAAQEVGVTITEMVGPGSWKHVPSGCTVQQGTATPESRADGTNGRVHFSTTSGDNNGGKGGYVLICKQAAVASPKKTQRIALFSAQFGGRDRILYRKSTSSLIANTEDAANRWTEPPSGRRVRHKLPDSVDAFIFTDMVNVERKQDSQWQFVYPAQQFEDVCDDNVLCSWKANSNLTRTQTQMQQILASKFFKTRWIAENTQYDYIIWMDGKYVVTNSNLVHTLHQYMGHGVDMLVMRHPERSTVAQEVGPASKRLAEILGDDSVIEQAKATYHRYRNEGFTDKTGLFDSGMFVVRPARVRNMFLDWWHEVQQGVPRDQISLPWMIQKHGINVSIIGPSEPGHMNTACLILGRICLNPNRHK